MTLLETLRTLHLPDLLTDQAGRAVESPAHWRQRRCELLDILAREEYGRTPPPVAVRGEVLGTEEAYAGKAVERRVRLTLDTPERAFSFPLYLALPATDTPRPLILLLNFRPDVPDRYYPVEEILDQGFGTAMLCYTDVSSDTDDLSDGLAGCFGLENRAGDGMGKLGVWAYAASRALDWLLTLPEVDARHIAVAGHSRLGKTALWCAAQDERIEICFDNDSGAGGQSITREKTGERVADSVRVFPYWYCENYKRYAGAEQTMPFDQHFLLAAIAPRLISVGAASLDDWADPTAALLCCIEADRAYRLLGAGGIAPPTRLPPPGAALRDGRIGFFLRPGAHYFSRSDWQQHMAFWRRHMEEQVQ